MRAKKTIQPVEKAAVVSVNVIYYASEEAMILPYRYTFCLKYRRQRKRGTSTAAHAWNVACVVYRALGYMERARFR